MGGGLFTADWPWMGALVLALVLALLHMSRTRRRHRARQDWVRYAGVARSAAAQAGDHEGQGDPTKDQRGKPRPVRREVERGHERETD